MKGDYMLRQLENILREASSIMLSARPEGITSKEGHANFVTEADRQTQDFLQGKLEALLPGSALFGEEKENEPLGEGPTWVVDPIDGTLNYIHGLMHSAIAAALVLDRQVTLCAVYNPYRDEMFTAEKGGGARLNGQPIHAADNPFERALTFYGTSPYQPALVDATFKAVAALMRQTADVRRFGSAILDLAYIACGRADIFFEYSLSPWDYTAGKLLVEEAGGVFQLLNLTNERLDYSKPAAVFAANPTCAPKALAVIEREYRAREGRQ